mmetsp:Transcript_64047/g.111605  ORF Transcript_64047/g.111605 Transcript_64047/m.111605 type:complete len:248 (+) Transcript_64047:330-1073(+)
MHHKDCKADAHQNTNDLHNLQHALPRTNARCTLRQRTLQVAASPVGQQPCLEHCREQHEHADSRQHNVEANQQQESCDLPSPVIHEEPVIVAVHLRLHLQEHIMGFTVASPPHSAPCQLEIRKSNEQCVTGNIFGNSQSEIYAQIRLQLVNATPLSFRASLSSVLFQETNEDEWVQVGEHSHRQHFPYPRVPPCISQPVVLHISYALGCDLPDPVQCENLHSHKNTVPKSKMTLRCTVGLDHLDTQD